MENKSTHANGLFLCMAKEFFSSTIPDICGFTVIGNTPWKNECFQADVEYPDGAMKRISAFVYPDRNEIWRFSLEPDEEKIQTAPEGKEEKRDPLEEWIEKNKGVILQLQMAAEDEGRNYFLIPSSLFPGEEIKEEVVTWLLDLGDYSFAGIAEDTGDVSVLLCE